MATGMVKDHILAGFGGRFGSVSSASRATDV